FRAGNQILRVVGYQQETAGWSHELTEFHEEAAGDSHYIDRASRRHAISRILKWLRTDRPVVLEIGCSSGFLLRDLQAQLPGAAVIGADCIQEPLEKLASSLPGVPLLGFDLVRCPLPDESVDAAVALNVLEHIDDDAGAIRQLFRILRPGG